MGERLRDPTYHHLYGRQAESLAKNELKCSVPQAQRFIDNFLADFNELRDWIDRQHRMVEEKGYVETPFGRRRRFPVITPSTKAGIQRQAVNSPIQSTASDITLTGLTRITNTIIEKGWSDKIIPLLTVHDSIVFEVHKDYVKQLVQIAFYELVQNPPIPLDVVLGIDMEVGPSYGDVDEFDWKSMLKDSQKTFLR